MAQNRQALYVSEFEIWTTQLDEKTYRDCSLLDVSREFTRES